MKINTLSKISHVNAETIRMYRNKGMLLPSRNPQNGYYDYTTEDLFHLLYIRKLRASNMPLLSIAGTSHDKPLNELILQFDKEIFRIDQKIQRLIQQRDILAFTQNQLKDCQEIPGQILDHNYPDDKYDCYDLETSKDPLLACWLEHMELFTQSLYIPMEVLNAPSLPNRIPVKSGIGSYKKLLKEQEIPIPSNAVLCPSGHYLSITLELEQLNFIPSQKLMPLISYAAAHQLTFTSSTTAFLIRVALNKKKRTFIYRIRARVDLQSPSTDCKNQ